ncbi:unnamed protein product [Cuscuta campestris]|uniref:Major facilitator superfamily (MFS) profile domain-containing protein n=1 Tax=Cuscuta campestris TaxID=132261 RepID=A0A484LKB7_9ASTE|nr:unnamed protein product [Cuscuta campestris]
MMKIKETEMMKIKEEEEEDGEEEEEVPKYRGIKAMPFIIGNETFEKLGAIGTLSNLLVYLTTVFHLTHISAANLLNVFNGTTNFATILGAFICDTYLGRYTTLALSTLNSFLGLLLISLTAAIKKLHPPACGGGGECAKPTTGQMGFLLCGFAMLIVGAAGIRPCNLAFGADQFNPKTESGKRGINSFFNWYFFTLTFAQMVSVTLVVYIQSEVSWSVGLGIPAAFMFFSGALFFSGDRMYVKVKPEGSPLTGIVQVLVVAAKNRKMKLPDQPSLSLFNNYTPAKSLNSKLPYTSQFRFLDKAAIACEDDTKKAEDGGWGGANPWRLCSLQQVEETKCVLRVVPFWAAAILYHVAMAQQQQYVVFQALQSDRHLGPNFQIPAATYTIFSMLALTLFVPLYDRFLVPFLRRYTRKEEGITLLQRLGIGIVLSVLASFVSAFVEQRRRRDAHASGGSISSMSALWLVPQLSLAGLSEAFTSIGLVEFYYKQFPENMKSVGGSFFFLGMGASSYLNSFLISIVHRTTESAKTGNWLPEDLNKGRLDYFYFLVTGLGVINMAYFLACSSWYQYKEGTGGEIKETEMEPKSVENKLAV